MTGWLINDTLTCIPNTKTLWHDLLDWFPRLEDKTGGHTSFENLADTIEKNLQNETAPDYIIRNATFFRRLSVDVPTISYLQDVYTDQRLWHQIEVCNNSVITVFNSSFVHNIYAPKIDCETCIIPIGTDFEHFCKESVEPIDILPDSILYVGSSDVTTKGFDVVLDLIDNTDYNFCLVMKHEYELEHPRVKVYNSVEHQVLKQIYNQCSVLICPSNIETLHLAGIEAGACGTPIVANPVGIYSDLKGDPRWGHLVTDGDFKTSLEKVLRDPTAYNPREVFLGAGLDKATSHNKWKELIEKVIG